MSDENEVTQDQPVLGDGYSPRAFEFLCYVMALAESAVGAPPQYSGLTYEERRRHADWAWGGRSLRFIETDARQYLRVRNGNACIWFESPAVHGFPGMRDMILRGLGLSRRPPDRAAVTRLQLDLKALPRPRPGAPSALEAVTSP